jgi:hypothetical protein
VSTEDQRERGAGARRWRRPLLVALGVMVGLAVTIRVAAPFAAAWWIESAVHRETGLPAHVEDVDLWLLRGAIAIEGAVVAARRGEMPERGLDPATALVSGRRLYVDLEWMDLLEGRIRLRELAVDGLRVRLETAPEGGVDLAFLSGISERAPESEPGKSPRTSSEAWPFRLDALVLRDARIEVVDPAIGPEPAALALAEISIEDLSFEGGAFSLGAVAIREPVVRLVRDFVLRTARGGVSEPTQQTAPTEPAPIARTDPVRYRAERFELERTAFTLLADGTPLQMAVAIQANSITLRGEAFPIEVQLEVEEGRVGLDGQLALMPATFEGRLRWNDLPVPLMLLAASPPLVPWIRACRASGELELEFRTEPGPAGEPAALRAQGTASIDGFDVANPGAEEEVALAWKQLTIDLREVVVPFGGGAEGSAPVRLAIDRVRLVEPRVLYTHPAESLGALLGAEAAPGEREVTDAEVDAPEAQAARTAAFELSIDLVELVDGELRYVDRAVDYRGRVRDLDVALTSLRWPGPRLASARATARPPQGKSLSLSGSLDGRSGTLEIGLEQLALPPLNPYAEGVGYRFGSGDLSLRTKLRATGTALDADNTVELHHLRVRALDPGDFQERFGMPLDLTLALLRDRSGTISLSVPVQVAEGGAGVGLASSVRSALRQALVGAASAPLKMAGFAVSGLGVGGATTEPLASVPGGAVLAEGQEERLSETATLLASRPGLRVQLHGRSGPDDLPGLAEQILIERLSSGEKLPELEGAGLLARRRVAGALRARGRGEPGELEPEDAALLGRYTAAVEVPPERLDDLARQRAEVARDSLLEEGGLSAERVSIGEPVGPGDPGVIMELASLEE